jgi:PKD repeat protein
VVRNTWATSGTYQVTLTVTDTKGQTNAVTKSVVVP